jgi:RimJ/RimL family protein N-acetyltransferase
MTPAAAPLPPVTLVPLDEGVLRRLAAGEAIGSVGGLRVAEGALPPPHVVDRVLEQLAEGTPVAWCMPYSLVSPEDRAHVGGLRFKAVPAEGRVEIGYGLAGEFRGRGFATAGVARMLVLAAASRNVSEVEAQVLPENTKSAAVLRRLGFEDRGRLVAHDGEEVVRWVRRLR